jgi:hypothetical protein
MKVMFGKGCIYSQSKEAFPQNTPEILDQKMGTIKGT